MRRSFFIGVAALYVFGFPYHPRLRSPNELVRLWQSRALVDFHRLDLNDAMRAYGPVRDLSVYDHLYYPSKAPLLSFAAAPIYAALKALHGGDPFAVPETELVFFSRLLLTVLPTLAMLVILARFLSAYAAPRVVDAVVVTYALGSLAFSYSLLFMSHQPTAVLVFAAFYCLWRAGRGEGPPGFYLAAGVCAGAAVAAEYTAALPVLALALYGLLTAGTAAAAPPALRPRAMATGALLFVLGALPFAVGLMAYHRACFGGPFESGYRHLADAGYQPWHLGGFLGIRVPDPRAFLLSFFSPLRGLFPLAPFLLLGAPGMRRLRERDAPLFWLTAVLVLAYAYFTSSFAYDSWGWTTGPRHLTPFVPFLLAPVALQIDSWHRRGNGVGMGLAAGLCAASVMTTGVLTGVNYIPDDVSNGVGALAVPLFAEHFFPPTALALFSRGPAPAAWPGVLWLLGLFAAAGSVAGVLIVRGKRSVWARAAFPGTLAAQALMLWLATRNDTADLNARRLLETAWLVRPGGGAASPPLSK